MIQHGFNIDSFLLHRVDSLGNPRTSQHGLCIDIANHFLFLLTNITLSGVRAISFAEAGTLLIYVCGPVVLQEHDFSSKCEVTTHYSLAVRRLH